MLTALLLKTGLFDAIPFMIDTGSRCGTQLRGKSRNAYNVPYFITDIISVCKTELAMYVYYENIQK